MIPKPQVALKTLGCRLNEAELEAWGQQFLRYGYGITSDVAQADVLVINTCAVTREAAKKSRQLIRQSRRRNPKAKLVISGCYASLNAETDTHLVDDMTGIDLLVHNQDKERLVDYVHKQLATQIRQSTPPPAGDADADIDTHSNALFQRGRNRAFIKVQDGCRYQCSFCIVTQARGRERSKPISTVIDEINRLHGQGVNEAVLTGVHIGGYGSDTGTSLVVLIAAVLAETDMPRIRIGSVEPWALGEGFLGLFTHPRLMPHLHLPMQSGADTALRRMARRCKTAEFHRLLAVARAHIADINITTDLIAGFPGETEAEWRQTLAFAQACRFSHVHVFPYSARAGTRAAALPGQVPAAIKKRRCRELRALADAMKQAYMQAHIGRECDVLIENDECGQAGEAAYCGYTPNYLKVAMPARQSRQHINRIVPVRITGYSEKQQRLAGEIRPAASRRPEDAAQRIMQGAV